MRVALIEDNADLGALISANLKDAGIQADIAVNGEAALDLIDTDVHDLIILDRGLPDMDGLELLKILRSENVKTPVLILTAKDGLGDKVEGLNSGADDYLVKPFEMDELVARMHALHRRPSDVIDTVLKVGNLKFFPAENRIETDEGSIDISTKEKEALAALIRLPGRIVNKDTLQNVLYGHGEEGSANSVEVIIHRLRKKLQQSNVNAEIRNLRGIGYLIKEKDE